MAEPIRAPRKEWDAVYHAAAQLDPLARCLGELHVRVAALEAMAKTVAMVVPITTADNLSPVEPAPQAQQGVPSAPELWELARVAKEQDRTGTGGPEWDDSHHIHQRDHIVAHRALFVHGFQRGLDAPRAPQGVTYEELVCLLREVEDNSLERLWKSSNRLQARHLLDHPRLGPLLRGEGAPAPVRVALPEEPIMDAWPGGEVCGEDAVVRYAWAAARAEVERQQQGGQADG